jgi:valyl-tRNA synthetase
MICATSEEEAQERAGAGTALTRDPDVLDTWFSSALWPFATLGWPDETQELAAYYPGNVNSTAREIIRLWENRMIWAGLEVMGEVPFTDVIIHSTVLAADGRGSKSWKRRPIVETIDAYGADATRYGLLKIRRRRTSGSPWRHRRGAQAHEQALERRAPDPAERRGHRAGLRPHGARGALDPGSDRRRPRSARGSMERIRLRHSGERPLSPHVRRLLRLVRGGDQAAPVRARGPCSATALAALERLLALLHPVLPHVTEEIWSHLPGERERLIVSPWPTPDDEHRADVEALDRVQEAAVTFRQRRSGRAGVGGRAAHLRRRRPAGTPEGGG